MRFGAELIDTWNMTITPVARTFETKRRDRYEFRDKECSKIESPGRPYMALRVRRLGS